ncbi:MAG: response regulator [Opitutaceae bacterium]|nr:response regulator [Opitutaceae bacterium]
MSKKATILVVDDEDSALQLIQEALTAVGYQVFTANDGAAAWQALESGAVKDVALLLTDLVMPQMDGMELARKVTLAYPDLRILFMSGYADDIVYAHQDMAGVSSFLPKPFDVVVLQKRVKEILGR